MMIIGCDYHPSFQQIAYVEQETGECGERCLHHLEEAVEFYRSLAGKTVRIGVEATGNARRERHRWLSAPRQRRCTPTQLRFLTADSPETTH